MTMLPKKGILISKEIHWFVYTLRRDYGVKVTAQDIAVEAVELGLDEVDAAFIPVELFQVVPETLLYEIMLVEDNKGNTWTGLVCFYPHSPNWCLQVIMKNDVLQLRKLLSILDTN